MSPPEPKRYWFYAKSHGWGWGLPCAWQGWVVFLAWLGVVALVAVTVGHIVAVFVPIMLLLAAGLHVVAWAKGEPARWRWGNRTGPRLREDER